MPDPTPDDDNQPPAKKREPTTCEFCDSLLSRRGEVLKMSERARALRKMEDENARLTGQLADRDGEISRLTADLAAVRATLAEAQAGDDDEDEDDDSVW